MIKSISVSILSATQPFNFGGQRNRESYISSGFVLRLVKQSNEKPSFDSALKYTYFRKKEVFYLSGLQA